MKRGKSFSYSRHLSSTIIPEQESLGTGGWDEAEVTQTYIHAVPWLILQPYLSSGHVVMP